MSVPLCVQLEQVWLELAQRVWQCWRETQSLWCVVLTSLETPYPLWPGGTILAGQLVEGESEAGEGREGEGGGLG